MDMEADRMDELEITFQNLDPSEAVEARIREKAAKLQKLYDRLVACRVTVSFPHRQHQTGNVPSIRIFLAVPEGELVVNRAPQKIGQKYQDPDVYTAIKEAFAAAERQLKEYKQQLRGDVKPKPLDQPLLGEIVTLHPEQDYGLLRAAEGRELYFHRNAVTEGAFDDLKVGDRVRYVETIGETGLQASRVWPPGD